MSNYYIENLVCKECGHSVWSEDPPKTHSREVIRCANFDCKNSVGTEAARHEEYPQWVITIEEWDKRLLEKFSAAEPKDILETMNKARGILETMYKRDKVEVIERTTDQTMRGIDKDAPHVLFDKDTDTVVVCWERTDEGALLKRYYHSHRFSVPLFHMPKIEQECFEKFFPDHNKIRITEGVNKDMVGYYKQELEEVKHGT